MSILFGGCNCLFDCVLNTFPTETPISPPGVADTATAACENEATETRAAAALTMATSAVMGAGAQRRRVRDRRSGPGPVFR